MPKQPDQAFRVDAKQAEPGARNDHLKESQRRIDLLTAILDTQADGISFVAPDGTILFSNCAFYQILGYEPDALKTIYVTFQRLFSEPGVMARAAALWARDIQREHPAQRSYQITRGDGERRWVNFTLSVLADKGIVLRVTDITEEQDEQQARVRFEEQLQQAQKMDAIGTLAGGIAHDMNNVLGMIMGFGSVLKETQPTGVKLTQCVDGILAAAHRGRDLTRNLLGFARKGSFRRTRFSLNHTVIEVRDILQRTVPKTIAIDVHLAPDLCDIEADAGQISHALMNLCLNAVEAMSGRGQLRIITEVTDIELNEVDSWVTMTPGRYVRLVVEDDGEGMDRHTLAHAFDPFFTTKPKGQGTGLGLSMVYGTAMNHGGDVKLTSEPGRGTRAALYLPAARGGTPPTVKATARPDPGSTPPATVLLVDDERLMLQAGQLLLESLGHSVLQAATGREAVQLYRDCFMRIDLVILDLVMPEMDGPEVFRALRGINPAARVLLCSGYPREDQVDQLIAQGALGFLRKPFERQSLALKVHHAMQPPPSGAAR